MSDEEKAVLETVVKKAMKSNKAVFDRLNDI
jgi:hypothetical protein